MNDGRTKAVWSARYKNFAGKDSYQFARVERMNDVHLPTGNPAIVGMVENWTDEQGPNWVAVRGTEHCGGFGTCAEAMAWVEGRVQGQENGRVNEKVRDLVHKFCDDWSVFGDLHLNRDVDRLVEQISALIPSDEPATTSEADEVVAKQNVTTFKSEVHWTKNDLDDGGSNTLEMWLPQEPFGHIAHRYLEALSDGVNVTIMDMPTVEGTAIDAIIIEPRIKPIYGERPQRRLYVVEEEN